MVSLDVLKQELNYKLPLQHILAQISLHLNKVSQQVSQFLKQTDKETSQYKSIIQNKLKPQISKLSQENQMFQQQLKSTKFKTIDNPAPAALSPTNQAQSKMESLDSESNQIS